MDSYLSVSGQTQTEKIIEKSRFITTSAHVCGEEEAKNFIGGISAKYSDATHNCYAYISDSAGNFLRFSDDGEPQGTAGMPMLEVLKSRRLCETAVVVTRYFGGIKLGAGGLVRAYSGCVAENLNCAEIVKYEMCSEYRYVLDYFGIDTALKIFSSRGAALISSEYAERAIFTAAVKKDGEEEFNLSLSNALNGRVEIKKLREYYFPFK